MTLTEDEALVLKQCYGMSRNFDEETVAEAGDIQEYLNADQSDDRLDGTTIATSVEECDADQGEECTLGGSTADEDETKLQDKSEAGTKVDDKQAEQLAPLHSPAVVYFLAIALFLMIAPSFIVVPCLVIAPVVLALAGRLAAESRRVGQ